MSRVHGWRLVACVLISCSAIAPTARAQSPQPLGTAGQWIVGGSAGGWYELSQPPRASAPDETGRRRIELRDAEQWRVWIAPNTLHFVASDLALGGSFGVGMEHLDLGDVEIDEASYGGSGLAAYRIGLGGRLFLLPELALGALRVTRSVNALSAPLGSDSFDRLSLRPLRNALALQYADATALRVQLTVPIAVSPAPGLFFGVGPYLDARYPLEGAIAPGARDWAVAAGVATVIGFWL